MSAIVVVVERPEEWPVELPGVETVSARSYLTDPELLGRRGLKVFNLCGSYRYQSRGYYVSLLAEARGHKPLPSVTTIQDLKSRSLIRFISDDLDALVQKSLARIVSDEFILSIYFGRNLAERHQGLALQLFNLFPAPLLRTRLVRQDRRWQVRSLRPIAFKEIPEEHYDFVIEAAKQYFNRRPRSTSRSPSRYDLAMLVDPGERLAPSDEPALRRFEKTGRRMGIRIDRVGRDDYGRLAEYDALFIRQTTQVDHHTYRFSRRAAAEGLVVIDDPSSILRCTNKVFLTEVLRRGRVPVPRTVIVERDQVDSALRELGLPAILKLPDGSFSQSVVRVDDAASFRREARRFLDTSDLVIAQEWWPTDFDWRIGVLDRQALFACRYKMVPGHWQVLRHEGDRIRYGGTDAVPLDDVPKRVLEVARAAADLVGAGFYGVDLKESDGRVVVIEVNDNPNVDADCEDGALGEELYRRILQVFVDRIERLREGKPLP